MPLEKHMKQKTKNYKKLFFNKWFFFLLIFSISLRLLWFNVPLEDDEGVMLYLSDSWLKGKNPYSYADTKTPISYMNYFPPLILKNHSFFVFRLYGCFIFFLSLFFLLLYLYEIRKNHKEALFGGFIYSILMHIPLLQGFLNKPGTFFNLYFVLSLYFLTKYFTSDNKKYFYLSSLFWAIALLSNSLNMVYIGIFNLILLFQKKKIKHIIQYSSISFAIGIVSLGYFYVRFKINLIYLAYVSIKSFYLIYSKYFAVFHNKGFPILYFEAIILMIGLILIGLKLYKKLNLTSKIALLLSMFALIYQTITPSFGHYLVSLFPIIVIFSSNLFNKIKQNINLKLFISLLLLFTFLTSIKYYPEHNIKNSVKFHEFSSYSEQQAIVSFLKNNLNENESFYYWGWNPGLYWLTNKNYPLTAFSLHMGCGTPFDYLYEDILNNTLKEGEIYCLLIVKENLSTDCNDFNLLIKNKYKVSFKTKIKNFEFYDLEFVNRSKQYTINKP